MNAFAAALAASFCWGVAPLFEKVGLRGSGGPVLSVLIRSLGIVLGMLVFLPSITRDQYRSVTLRQVLFLIIGGFTANFVGQLFFYRALKTGTVSQIVPVAASYPALSCVLGIALFGEPLTAGKAFGIALVMAGTYLLK